MSDFDSLTWALEGWFDTRECDLPAELQQRLRLLPWDDLTPDQRRGMALQLDYQNDPATVEDQQSWSERSDCRDSLEKRIANWEASHSPTSGELALKETRLKALRQELSLKELQERLARCDYYPERPSLDVDKETAPTDYVAFPRAMKILAGRLGAKPEELAVWIFLGPDAGGIAAYRNVNELNPPQRFYFDSFMGEDYLSPLMACWFQQYDVDRFDPADRYITGAALIERWSSQPGLCPEAFIRAKIVGSNLLDIHPTFGGTRGTHGDDMSYPPLSAGLFATSQIDQVEAEDALDAAPIPPDSDVELKVVLPASNSPDVQSHPFSDQCTVFRRMSGLHPSEITIAIVGDNSESGLSGNNMLEISARRVKRRVSLAEFGLVDRRRGSLNKLGAILVGMSHGERFYRNKDKNSALMKRLRAEVRNRMGIKADPFNYHKDAGWQPNFAICDLRGRSDERAKDQAERRTVSLNREQDHGRQFAGEEGKSTFEPDEADTWLRENDPTHFS